MMASTLKVPVVTGPDATLRTQSFSTTLWQSLVILIERTQYDHRDQWQRSMTEINIRRLFQSLVIVTERNQYDHRDQWQRSIWGDSNRVWSYWRNPLPQGGFLFTMFPDQEPCVRDFTTRCDGGILETLRSSPLRSTKREDGRECDQNLISAA